LAGCVNYSVSHDPDPASHVECRLSNRGAFVVGRRRPRSRAASGGSRLGILS
jgi:hypothetical protein